MAGCSAWSGAWFVVKVASGGLRWLLVCGMWYVCVRERERERERKRKRKRGREGGREGGRDTESVCVCVVCVFTHMHHPHI